MPETHESLEALGGRDADVFEMLRRDLEEDPPPSAHKTPAEALQSIQDRALVMNEAGQDIEDLPPDMAARLAREDQADYLRLGPIEKSEASTMIVAKFRNRAYSAEFARHDPQAAQDIVREGSRQEDVRRQLLGERMAFDSTNADAAAEELQRDHPGSLALNALNNGYGWGEAAKLAEQEGHHQTALIFAETAGRWKQLLDTQQSAQQTLDMARRADANTHFRPAPEENAPDIAASIKGVRQLETTVAPAGDVQRSHPDSPPPAQPSLPLEFIGEPALKSWEKLKETARSLGLTAAITSGGADENAPPYLISYATEKGRLPITSELYKDGKVITRHHDESVPGLEIALQKVRIDELQKERSREQLEATRQSEFAQARQTLDANAAEALKVKLIQDSTGQHNVAVQAGEDTRSYFKNPSIHAANSVLNNLRRDIANKLFSKIDFAVLPKLIQRKSKVDGKTVFDNEAQPVNQIRDDAPSKLEKDGRVTENKEFDGRRVLKVGELPPQFRKKFVVSDEVPGKFFYYDTHKLAFSDHGGKLATNENKPEVIRSMVELAKEKNWSSIILSGTDEFKREAWLQASLEGIEVKGFKPQPEDLARFDQERDQRMKNRISQAPGDAHPAPTEQPPANEILANPEPPARVQPNAPTQHITLSIAGGGNVDPDVLRVIESAMSRPNPNEVSHIKIPDDYKPSPDAIAVAEVMRAKGAPENKMRLVMYGVDMNNQMARELGLPAFQAKIFDPTQPPQGQSKAVSVAIEKTPAQQPVVDIAAPQQNRRR